MKNSLLLGGLVVGLLSIFSCGSIKTADRPELADSEQPGSQMTRTRESVNSGKDPDRLSDKDLEKYAYELGLDPKKGFTDTERKDVMNRRRLRQLERGLDSPRERVNYSKVLPLFANDLERIEYLSIPSLEGRQAWANRNKIWGREKINPDLVVAAEAKDIAVGMTQDLVRQSWGEPTQVEQSGNPIYKNERWKYIRELPTLSGYKRQRRYVYFEAGRVVGWETE